MAIVDRGTTSATPATATNLAVASATFTPAAGSTLIVLTSNRTSAADTFPAITDTFGDTGGTAWVLAVNARGSAQPQDESIFSRTVGTSPASGAITATTALPGTSTSRNVLLTVLETSSYLATATQAPSNIGTATPLTITFSAAPAATALVVSIFDGNANAAPTLPTGFTSAFLSTYASEGVGVVYREGGAASTVVWALTAANPLTGAAAEFPAIAGATSISPFKTAPDALTRRRMGYRVPAAEIPTPPASVDHQRAFLVAPDATTRRRFGLPALVFTDPTTPVPPPPPDFGAARPLVAPDAQTRRRLGLNPFLFEDPTTPAPPPPPVLQQPTFLTAPDAQTRRRLGLNPFILEDATGPIPGASGSMAVTLGAFTMVASGTADYPWPSWQGTAPDAQTRRRLGLGAFLFTDPTGQVAPLAPIGPQQRFLTAPDAQTRRRSGLPAPPLLGDPVGPTAAVTGSMAVTLDPFVMAASGGVGAAGSMAVTLDLFVMAAQGSSVTGTIASTLDAFTMAATGTTDLPIQGGGHYPTVHRHLETTWVLTQLTHETAVIANLGDRKRRNLIALIVLGVI